MLLILILVVYLTIFMPLNRNKKLSGGGLSTNQVNRLWSLSQEALREHKTLKAEKALLTILQVDKKNAVAYNRLGVLYARERRFDDAIECLEISQSLDPNATSLHNVGLIYLETQNYEKAAMAFEQAIELEGDLPARYIAYSKALIQLGRWDDAIEALETAYDLEANPLILRHMLEVYEKSDNETGIKATNQRLEDLKTIKRQQAVSKAKFTRSKTMHRRPKSNTLRRSPATNLRTKTTTSPKNLNKVRKIK